MKPIVAQPGLVERVYDALMHAIADGSLPPGERLAQETIATRLQVSRQPVSHALALLRQQGLVIEQGKRGLIVVPLDATRVRGLYEVRTALDGLAARLAARKVSTGEHDTDLLKHMESTMQQGYQAIASGNSRDRIEADVAFHVALYELSGNTAIMEACAGMWPHFRRAMGLVLRDSKLREIAIDEHGKILAAIKQGDAESAEHWAQRHTRDAGAEVHRQLSEEKQSR